VPQSPPAFAGAGYCPKCQGAAAKDWLAAREADLLPVGYFHVVFTLPAEISPIAYQNKAVLYDLLFRTAAETRLTIAPTGQARGLKAHDPKSPRRSHRRHRGAPQLGLGDDPEPSLMMPGIIISCIFNEQGKLIFRAAPLQN
jgi:hypothetical protein